MASTVLAWCAINWTTSNISQDSLTPQQLLQKDQECLGYKLDIEKEIKYSETIPALWEIQILPSWYQIPIENEIENKNYKEDNNIYNTLSSLWRNIDDINYHIILDDVFYSKTMDSCLYSTIAYTDFGGWMISKDMSIYDFYNKENVVWHLVWKKVFYTFCHIGNNWCNHQNEAFTNNKLELKWK